MDSTYSNCFAILETVRYGIFEFSDSLVRGQIKGSHYNEWLVRQINDAQAYVYSMIRKRLPGFFVSKATITGVNSVFALPADYGSLIVFKNDQGQQVFPVDYDRLKRPTQTGNKLLYYKKGTDLIVDKDGITQTYTLWYFKRPRELTMGKIDTAGTGTCTLDKNAKRIADYYNNARIECIDGDWDDVISDYTAARVVTLTDNTQAVTKGHYYGTVPEIPDFSRHLIAPRTVLHVRSNSPICKAGPPSRADLNLYNEQIVAMLRDYQDTEPDVDWEQILGDFAPRQHIFGIVTE